MSYHHHGQAERRKALVFDWRPVFTGAGQINTGATADLYSGFAIISDPATAGDTNTFIPDQSNDDTIDLGSVEQGWLSGGLITLTAQSATRWHCAAYLLGDATLATPFE